VTGIQGALSLGKGLRVLDPLLRVWRVLTSLYFALGLIGFLALAGLVITSYLPRRRLWVRITRRQTDIAAPAERSGGFKSDMRKLAERLGLEGEAARELEEG
jgi:hypothetical protein